MSRAANSRLDLFAADGFGDAMNGGDSSLGAGGGATLDLEVDELDQDADQDEPDDEQAADQDELDDDDDDDDFDDDFDEDDDDDLDEDDDDDLDDDLDDIGFAMAAGSDLASPTSASDNFVDTDGAGGAVVKMEAIDSPPPLLPGPSSKSKAGRSTRISFSHTTVQYSRNNKTIWSI